MIGPCCGLQWRPWCFNAAIVVALNRGSKGDINVRAAVIHMAGDAVGALAIIIGALAIRYTGLTYIDPILSIVLALFIIYTAWDICASPAIFFWKACRVEWS